MALNDAQRGAVEHAGGPLLVIAGAGSGKTRVLTARIEHLMSRGVAAEAILAFTFTNRAAREMRDRIAARLGEGAARLWVGTFHATAVRILRREAGALDRPRDFVIYDREDQEGVLRGIVKRLELPEAAFRIGLLIQRISDAKNALVDPAEMLRLAVNPHQRQIAEVAAEYRDQLRRQGAYDFDDLIAECVRLFRERPEVGARYARRFEHVLVDEYQDTNHAQFRLVEALSREHRNLFVVGDDDQSIYGWRGADLSNVLEFEQAFAGAAVVRLEQNYRSTAPILRAANAVIANNRSRKGKTLWCEREGGAPLRFILAGDEVEEARRIRGALEGWVRGGGRLSGCAVLYRTNAQSRALEIELRQHGMPYQIVGGVSFYQRREVKDMLAYLRLAVNPADAVSFWRVWNTPRRGLGSGVREKVEARMRDGETPLEALRALADSGALARAARSGASELLELIREISDRREEAPDALLLRVIERTRYLEHLAEDSEGAPDERRANVEELVAAAGAGAPEGGGLAEFLAETALVTDADRMSEEAERVLLLTAHNAKGLEFDRVVIAGAEEGLFPHASALEDPAELEEERRLFYVALTRARDEVLLTAAAFRRRFDGARGGVPSRFVDEIPSDVLERDDVESAIPRRSTFGHGHGRGGRAAVGGRAAGGSALEDDATVWDEGAVPSQTVRARPQVRARSVGREVTHERFGRGVVLEAEGEGDDLRFTVRFGTTIKKVLGRFLEGGHDVD
jgi:DNA helicase-2/ATP-dependent DNA helicase PcrA